MSESYLSVLQIDPLFKEKLGEMQFELDERFLEDRANAMQILEAGAVKSARVVVQAATEGRVGNVDPETGGIDYETVSVANQIKSAWDVLDHTGNKAPEKRLVGHFDAAELVKEAYVRKYPKEDNGGNGDKPSSGKPPETSHASSAFDNLNESSPKPVDEEVKFLVEQNP